MNSPSWGKAG